ncbi:MAG TPA: cbb3-type cytochrome c oxidase subunit I [Saprospiraceae bacterium]|nr:cbb3-type cytochrome c oxidase subunit I [Saprospiraceae bacterium]
MKWNISKGLRAVIILELAIPLTLLALGIYHGLMQTLYRSGMISMREFAALEYYQGLTLHGVINAIVLTTFFAVAFGHACMTYYLKRKISTPLAWLSFALMLIGTLLAAWAMLTGEASVLYTFYPPLKAHPLFYIGVALLVVGSWIAYFSWIPPFLAWRRENIGSKMPLAVLGTLVNFTVWFVCTLPVAYEVLVLLLPWSMGWTPDVNVPLCRTLFWFFGHALVYFWLLPAYIMFYTMLPELAGGKLFSGNAGRLVFFLFLVLSIPVGVHHQFSEPSLSRGIKMVHTILTFGIAVPSFITAFTLAATLEYAGVQRGAKSLFGWLGKLPYFDRDRYLFAYLITGLILFIFGGLTGLVNASYSLNSVIHNTAWMPGHFHMTVAGPVFLAILGMSLYLLTNVTGRVLSPFMKNIAVIVPHLWMIGLLIFSTGLMWGGLLGEPRRTNLGISYLDPESPLFRPDWVPTTALALFGGVIMFSAAGLYFIVLIKLLFTKKTEEPGLEFPEYAVLHDEPRIGILDNFRPWLVLMVLVIALAYIPAFRDVLKFTGDKAPPYSPQNPAPLELYQKTE